MQVTHCRSLFLLVSIVFAVTAEGQDAVERPSPSPSPSVNGSGAAEAERVIVTGSNIPTAEEVGPNPVLELNRDYIEKAPERNTEQLLRNLPVANANGIPTSGNAGAFESGGASISLRGLDPGATLVLINGHRIPSHPAGAINGVESYFDLNTIPRAAIESIEILKDGASTTYGADAIAGVVNIKLRRDYRGAEINLEYGNSTDTDSGEFASSLVFGVGNNDTDLTGVVNYYSRNSINRRDLSFDLKRTVRSTNASPFNLEVSRESVLAGLKLPPDPIPNLNPKDYPQYYTTTQSGQSFLNAAGLAVIGGPEGKNLAQIPGTDAKGNFLIANTQPVFADDGTQLGVDLGPQTFFAHAPFLTNGTAPASSYVFTANRAVINPVFLDGSQVPDTERYGAFLNADHKILGDQLVAYGDLFFERADVTYVQNPAPTNDFSEVPLAIPPHSPGVLLGGPSYAEVGLPANAYNPFNPFDQIISGASRGRLFDFGPRTSDITTDSFFSTVGLHGDKLFEGTWGYDVAFRYCHMESRNDFSPVVRISRFQQVLNAADPIFDPASREFIGTTVPYNPFGDFRRPITNNQRFDDFVLTTSHEINRGTLATFDLNIYNTEVWKLPAGPIGLAFGAQFQYESAEQTADHLTAAGDILNVGFGPVGGNRKSCAGYAETSIPIFGADFRGPGVHALDFTAAVRYEAFDNGNNVMVPKFGLRWQPINDSLTIRATWGEGFRQPTIPELTAATVTGFATVFDPKKGEMVDVTATILANPTLQPEDSRNFSGGIVYSPKFASGLTLTIDLFNIETIGWINPARDASDALALIESGHPFPGESTTRDAAGNLTQLTFIGYVNTGTQKVRGADFSISYELPTSIGTFRSLTEVTYLDSYQFSPMPGATENELRSRPVTDVSDDAYLKWKGVSQQEWLWRGLDAVFTIRYYDGFHELPKGRGPDSHIVLVYPNNLKEHWVSQTWLFDLQVSYEVGKISPSNEAERFHNGWPTWRFLLDQTKFTVGINNIFDHDPPRSHDNFPRFIYDPTGRFVYFSVTKRFW